MRDLLMHTFVHSAALCQTRLMAEEAASITFRAGVPGDAETIADYHHRCRQIAFAPILPAGALDAVDATSSLDRWKQWLGPDGEETATVAELNGRAIGHVVIRNNEILHLFVDPNHWRHGLGRQLLDLGEQLLREQGHTQIQLHTMVGNKPAITMYERNGWVMTDQLDPDEINGQTYWEHVLVKTLR